MREVADGIVASNLLRKPIAECRGCATLRLGVVDRAHRRSPWTPPLAGRRRCLGVAGAAADELPAGCALERDRGSAGRHTPPGSSSGRSPPLLPAGRSRCLSCHSWCMMWPDGSPYRLAPGAPFPSTPQDPSPSPRHDRAAGHSSLGRRHRASVRPAASRVLHPRSLRVHGVPAREPLAGVPRSARGAWGRGVSCWATWRGFSHPGSRPRVPGAGLRDVPAVGSGAACQAVQYPELRRASRPSAARRQEGLGSRRSAFRDLRQFTHGRPRVPGRPSRRCPGRASPRGCRAPL